MPSALLRAFCGTRPGTLPGTGSLTKTRIACAVFFALTTLPVLSSGARAQQDCTDVVQNNGVRRIGIRTDTTLASAVSRVCEITGPKLSAHSSGGWRLAFVLGDSIDHLRHNAINIGVLSTGLALFLWSLPEDLPRFKMQNVSVARLREAFSRPPIWADGDWWLWNWVAHPFVGMQEYLMERNWGSSPFRAFLFSTVASLAWEYAFESWMEQPSVQDMLLTSPVGLVLGEGVHQLTQQLRKNGFSTSEKMIVLVLNPVHVLQHGFR